MDRRDLPIADDKIFDYPVVFMDGRSAFQFTPAERAQLRLYVERGGVLVSDSICASKAFAASFRDEMQKIFAPRSWNRFRWTIRCSRPDLAVST